MNETTKKIRSSNIELLRIVCMLAIIAHHCIIHGGGSTMDNCGNKLIGMLFIPLGKICFCAFVAISAWFTVDSKFKASRFLKVWFEILFYNLVFMALTSLLGTGYAPEITWNNWLGAFFPMFGNSHGFAASYAVYYLLTPFLAMIKDRLNQKSAGLLVVLLFGIQVFSSLLSIFTQYSQPIPSELLLFVFFYFTAYYLKKWPFGFQTNRLISVFTFMLIYGVSLLSWIGYAYDPEHATIYSHLGLLVANESSIGNILAGFALFFFAQSITIPHIPAINMIATTTFGILLYHDHNYFRPVVWHRFVQASTWYYVGHFEFLLYVILATLAVFTVGAVFDFLRQHLLEKPFMKSKLFNKLCEKIDDLLAEKEADAE